MFVRPVFTMACVAAALTGAVVKADCSDPNAFGSGPYQILTSPGFAPHLEDDDLVVRVTGRGLALADECDVPPNEQFTLHWVKEQDMAIVKLKREVPDECLGGGETADQETQATQATVSPESAIELRVPLPFELRRGAEDFSRMMLGMPPGGIYEAYKIFDHSVLTKSAAAYLEEMEEESEITFTEGDDDAEDFDFDDDAPLDEANSAPTETTPTKDTRDATQETITSSVPRKAGGAEKVATE